MSRPLRIEFPNAWYHVMNRGRRRELVFGERKDYFSFLDVVREACQVLHLRVAAYCLMPNHYHLLVQTPRGNISRCMRHVDGVYTQRFNRRHNSDGPLFRGRYRAILIDADTYLLQLVRYIHRNPLRAGSTQKIDAYAWSSHDGYVSNHPEWQWLHKDILLAMFSENSQARIRAYQEYVSDEDEKGLIKIYSKRRWPVFLGSEKFAATLKQKFFRQKMDVEIPQSKELAPDVNHITKTVAKFYKVSLEDLVCSRRGCFNEPRNVAIYLTRKLRGDTLKKTGDYFKIDNYSSVSSTIERMKILIAQDPVVRRKVDKLVSLVVKSQEQT